MLDATWGELSSTLEGRLSATYTARFSTGTAVYHGVSGDFKGIKLMMSYILDTTTGPAGTPWLVTYQAIVLDPHSGKQTEDARGTARFSAPASSRWLRRHMVAELLSG
jgi:hypothetical protein